MQAPAPYNPPLTWRGQLWRILLATLIGGLIWLTVAPAQWRDSPALFWLDLGLGVLATGLALLRRRWPLPIALTLAVFGAVSALSSGAGLLAGVSRWPPAGCSGRSRWSAWSASPRASSSP